MYEISHNYKSVWGMMNFTVAKAETQSTAWWNGLSSDLFHNKGRPDVLPSPTITLFSSRMWQWKHELFGEDALRLEAQKHYPLIPHEQVWQGVENESKWALKHPKIQANM